MLKLGWAAGFGTKNLFEYDIGASTIPLDRINEGERHWLEASPYGGGPILGGTTMEEPDNKR